MSDRYITVEQHDDYTEITVLKPCTVHWSADGVTWRQLAQMEPRMFRKGPHRLLDCDAPAEQPRSYAVFVDGRMTQVVPTPAARAAFGDVMRAWFPEDDDDG